MDRKKTHNLFVPLSIYDFSATRRWFSCAIKLKIEHWMETQIPYFSKTNGEIISFGQRRSEAATNAFAIFKFNFSHCKKRCKMIFKKVINFAIYRMLRLVVWRLVESSFAFFSIVTKRVRKTVTSTHRLCALRTNFLSRITRFWMRLIGFVTMPSSKTTKRQIITFE